ncbi:methylmalonyl-CoA epimerase [Neobacillus niacini]|uniref:VOC family protein n=1 Tax=Neobacillus niacini TaxID=86668 RepID=UPI00285B1B74|nr:VOC family protein [Neobacillus niacini]MDR7076136.1 methylmalonyl-CoA epimerase [Neobacillus niacini]
MIKKIHHIGIIVKNVEEAVKPYEQGLGLANITFETVESFNVKIAFIPVGDVQIELIQPLAEDDEFAQFVNNGGALHHIAFEVTNLEDRILQLLERAIRMKDHEPKIGSHGAKIAFADASNFDQVRVEFIEPTYKPLPK